MNAHNEQQGYTAADMADQAAAAFERGRESVLAELLARVKGDPDAVAEQPAAAPGIDLRRFIPMLDRAEATAPSLAVRKEIAELRALIDASPQGVSDEQE